MDCLALMFDGIGWVDEAARKHMFCIVYHEFCWSPWPRLLQLERRLASTFGFVNSLERNPEELLL